MRSLPIFHIDAFTAKSFGGNPAGVVPIADSLTESEMQKIANELNLSETAFLLQSDDDTADYKIRYFTPTEEVDFCGHATIAAAWLMGTKYDWINKSDTICFSSNIGVIPVKWSLKAGILESVSMTQVSPRVESISLDTKTIAELVGINIEDIDDRFPIKKSNTGIWHLLIPVKTRAAIDNAIPNKVRLGNMNKEHGIATTHLFTFEGADEFDLYTRDFCPAIGIDEDPVTGSANGALAGYLYVEHFLEANKTHTLTISQGQTMNRPGTVYVTVKPHGQSPIIEVAGAASITIEGKLF